ncbi:MAG: hypothetical protein KF819_35040 [Labilithrix sp.]|nr:hypothetical protein [Labilithrix sp.]
MGKKRIFSFLPIAALIGACSSADSDPPSPGGDGGGGPPVEAGPSGDGGVPALDAGPTDPVSFKIQIDYRYDTAGFFSDPVRRQALEGACRIWGRLVKSTFANVPAGTFIRVRDPQKPNEPALSLDIDYEIDDLVIFVGSAELPAGQTGIASPTAGLSGVTDDTLRASLQARFDGPVFQPWTGWVAFDATTPFHFDPVPELGDAVPAGTVDFVSVALHEIGHVLGFATSDAFKGQIANGAFTGPKTQSRHGGPLALTPDLGHVPNETMSGGRRLLMDQSDAAGTRYLPTPLDLAVFEDLGFVF